MNFNKLTSLQNNGQIKARPTQINCLKQNKNKQNVKNVCNQNTSKLQNENKFKHETIILIFQTQEVYN
jgi:hypothetical protein